MLPSTVFDKSSVIWPHPLFLNWWGVGAYHGSMRVDVKVCVCFLTPLCFFPLIPPIGHLARSHPKYFFLGFSAALAPKFHPFHPGAPTLEIPRAQRSRAPGRDLEAQAWIWRPRHGFRVPGMDLEAQAWI